MFLYYLYYFWYGSVSIYNLSIRKYLLIAALLQPFVYRSANLVRILKSFSYSSFLNYLALSVPTLSLLVTFYIGALSLIRPYMLNLWSSFCSYYIIILYLNLSIFSFSPYLISRSLKCSFFLINILTL